MNRINLLGPCTNSDDSMDLHVVRGILVMFLSNFWGLESVFCKHITNDRSR